jgi:hypothetical protein
MLHRLRHTRESGDERRARGFDLRRAPHTQVALFQVADREYLYLHMFDLAL